MKQFSEKGIEKGTQTDPFYCPKPQKNEGFQKPLNNNNLYIDNNIDNISLIHKDIDHIEDFGKKIEKQNFEKLYHKNESHSSVKEQNEKEKSSAQKEKEVLALYLTVCASFPKIVQLTAKRKEKILRRLTEMGEIKIAEQVFRKMEASDFLKGKNKFGWKASFDWVFGNSENWLKIIEGNYDNRTSQPNIVKPANDARFMGMLQTDLSKF